MPACLSVYLATATRPKIRGSRLRGSQAALTADAWVKTRGRRPGGGGGGVVGGGRVGGREGG